jgi:hypothetical protein
MTLKRATLVKMIIFHLIRCMIHSWTRWLYTYILSCIKMPIWISRRRTILISVTRLSSDLAILSMVTNQKVWNASVLQENPLQKLIKRSINWRHSTNLWHTFEKNTQSPSDSLITINFLVKIQTRTTLLSSSCSKKTDLSIKLTSKICITGISRPLVFLQMSSNQMMRSQINFTGRNLMKMVRCKES